MQPAELFVELRNLLSATDSPVVLPAIKADRLVWSTLNQAELLYSVLGVDSHQVEAWCPAEVGLRLLGCRIPAKNLRADNMPMIESGLRRKALNALENMMRTGDGPQTLVEACLVALALRERRRKTQTWEGFYNEIASLMFRSPACPADVWDTPLACLYGLIPDPEKLIEALCQKEEIFPSARWITHILISNPLTETEQKEKLGNVLVRLSLINQVEWLRFLANRGRNSLVHTLSASLLIDHREDLDEIRNTLEPDELNWTTLSKKILEFEAIASLHQFAGHPIQAAMFLEKVRTGLHHWLVGSTFQIASIAGRSGVNHEGIWKECEEIVSVLPVSDKLQTELIFLPETINSPVFNRDSQGVTQPVLARVFQAFKRAKNGFPREGQEIAREAVGYWLAQAGQSMYSLGGQYVFDFQPWPLLDALVYLGLLSQALEVAEVFLRVKPMDTRLLEWTADLCHKTGDKEKALDLIHQVILLEPEKVEPCRKLAEFLEGHRLWQAAMEERYKILEMVPLPALDDTLALAKCVYEGGKYSEVKQVCKKILSINPDHGMAYAYMGMAIAKEGALEEGITYLSKATLLIPENSLPWVELAKIQILKGDGPRALETLRTAILNAPDSAELHFALGNTCLMLGSATEALPFLRQSARLAPESNEVALALSKTLQSLGHEREALEVVEKARVRWPVDGGLAFLHARILLENEDHDTGLSILETALQCDQPEADWFVLYSGELLGDPEKYILASDEKLDYANVVKAQKALQKAMRIDGNQFETRLMLAEVLALRKEFEAAFAAYQQIVETDEVNQSQWYWRVQAGFGKTALTLGQYETALAALQNAASAHPESIGLYRVLTDAYIKVSLCDSALHSAQTVLSMAPDDPGNLSWYAHTMEAIRAYENGINALKTAIQFEPNNVQFAIRLADLLIKNGDKNSAMDALKRAIEIPSISSEDLRRAAHEAMRLGEIDLALTTLENAVEKAGDSSDELRFELAYLYKAGGRDEDALESVQRAIGLNPSRVPYYLLQSDLQEKLDRPQAALASLERVLRIRESQGVQGYPVDSQEKAHRQSWIELPDSMAEIHVRFSRLFEKMNNLNSALYHADKAVEFCPFSAQVRHKAVEIALRLLQNERAAQLSDLPKGDEGGDCLISADQSEAGYWVAGLLGIRAHLAIEQGDFPLAGMLIDQGLAHDPIHPFVLCSQIRSLANRGDYRQGEELFNQVFAQILPDCRVERVGEESGRVNLNISHLMLALAGNDLFRWKAGLDLLGIYIRQYDNEPWGLLLYIREMVRAAEWQSAGKQLKMVVRIYPESLLSDSCVTRFSQLVSNFKKVSNSKEIERWKARGEAIFIPTEAHMRTLATYQINDEDAAWLVYGLNRVGNTQAATQLGDQFNRSGLVQAMAAKALKEINPIKALETARNAVELTPLHAYCQAGLAEIAEMNKEYAIAGEALGVGLKLWEDEPIWHLWAARLSEFCCEFEATIPHLEQAFELAPGNIEIAKTLGSYYLKQGEYENAERVLSTTTQSAPKDEQIWFALAEAYQGLKRYGEGLKAAERAVELSSYPTRALVLAGEIALAMGDVPGALEFVRNAQKHTPKDVDSRLLTARILICEKKENEALKELTNALEEIPAAFEIHLERAKLLYKLNGATQAVELFQKLADEYPQDERVLRMLAIVYMEMGNHKLAEKAAGLSLRMKSFQPDLHLMLGRIYQGSGQLDKAVFHLSEAARLNPNDIESLLELGKTYTTRREFSEALSTYQYSIQVAPEDYRPYYLSALVLRDGKDYPGAEIMLRRAALLAPEDVNIRRTLGAIVALNLVQNCQEASSCM